jgi:hypothetical protein
VEYRPEVYVERGKALVDVGPELSDGVVYWHAAVVALCVVMDFLHLIPAARFEVAVFDFISTLPACNFGLCP